MTMKGSKYDDDDGDDDTEDCYDDDEGSDEDNFHKYLMAWELVSSTSKYKLLINTKSICFPLHYIKQDIKVIE